MTDALAAFPITKKWPALHPERLQLYSLPTPNGVKVSIALEEIGLAYEPHLVSFQTNDQLTPEFISLNPNNKIPAIVDPDGPGGKPLALFLHKPLFLNAPGDPELDYDEYQIAAMRAGLREIADRQFSFAPLITHRFGLDGVDAAFELMAAAPPEFVKSIIVP